jgi:MFS family permease
MPESRGWPVVVTGCIGSAVGLAALPFYGLSSFMKPLEQEFGWSRTQIGLASTCLTIGLFTTAPFIGYACDRLGIRRVVLPSIVLLAACLAALSLIGPGVWSLYVGYLLMAVLGSGTTPVTYSAAVAPRYSRRRGLALGLTLAGTGLAGVFAPRILTAVIASHGWRSGWLVMSGFALIAWPLAFRFLRSSPTAHGEVSRGAGSALAEPMGHTLREASRDYRFWVIAGAFFAISLGISGLILNMIVMLEDAGLPAARAAATASLIGVGVIAARVSVGYLLDRFFAPAVGTCVFLITAAGCWLLATNGPSTATLAAFLIGFAMGSEVDLIAYLVARYFGLRQYGAINGWGYSSYNVGAALSPFLVGSLFAATGGYAVPLECAAVLCSLGGLSLLALGPYEPSRTGVSKY